MVKREISFAQCLWNRLSRLRSPERFLLHFRWILPRCPPMQTPARWLAALLCASALTAAAAAPKPPGDDLEHIREELGVNEFTAPSINLILQELNALKPIPFEKVWRDLP